MQILTGDDTSSSNNNSSSNHQHPGTSNVVSFDGGGGDGGGYDITNPNDVLSEQRNSVFSIEDDDSCCVEEMEDDEDGFGGGGYEGIELSAINQSTIDILHHQSDDESSRSSNGTNNSSKNNNRVVGDNGKKKKSTTGRRSIGSVGGSIRDGILKFRNKHNNRNNNNNNNNKEEQRNLNQHNNDNVDEVHNDGIGAYGPILSRISNVLTTLKERVLARRSISFCPSSMPGGGCACLKKRAPNGCMAIILIVTTLACITGGIKMFALHDRNVENQNSNSNYVAPQSRVEEVINFLFESEVSSLPSLKLAGTPEREAAAFISDGDLLRLNYTSDYVRFKERYILAILYYATNGPTFKNQWTNHYHWLTGIDHCMWNEQKETSRGPFLKGVECDKPGGRVIGLDLSNNNLVGRVLPTELNQLSSLTKLHLHHNEFGGNVPNLVPLKNLASVGMMETNIVGTLPDWFGDMTQLTTLALSKNSKMYGSIPPNYSNLKALRILGLDGMGLVGNIDSIKKLNSLQALYLNDNQLNGTLDNTHWNDILELDVSNNEFYGTVSSKLLQYPKLQVLDLNRNKFDGKFPDDILPNDSVQFIAMHENQLTGTISDRIGYLTNLQHLDIRSNQLTGTIPDTMKELTNMVSLSMSKNKFNESPLHDYYSKMTNLKELSMKSCNLTGGFPDFVVELGKLQILDLDSNQLVGSIPNWVGHLTNLKALLLNRNEFHGTIPSELAQLQKLDVLLLDNNNLYGNTNAICLSPHGMSMEHFITDCYHDQEDEEPEVKCRCCTLCCGDPNDAHCNNAKWTLNGDLITNYGDTRPLYDFNVDQ